MYTPPSDPIAGESAEGAGLSRRGFLSLGALGALAALAPWQGGEAVAAPAPASKITPAAALADLMQGNARYLANRPLERDYSAGRAARVTTHAPTAAVLSCADARVPVDLVFDQGPGEIFSVRVAGNILTTDLLASIEYAVHVLKAPLVMVLGHSQCGAVKATIQALEEDSLLPGHLPTLIQALSPAVSAGKRMHAADLVDAVTVANVRRQVGLLKQAAPIVDHAAKEGQVKIVGAVYDIATGKVRLV